MPSLSNITTAIRKIIDRYSDVAKRAVLLQQFMFLARRIATEDLSCILSRHNTLCFASKDKSASQLPICSFPAWQRGDLVEFLYEMKKLKLLNRSIASDLAWVRGPAVDLVYPHLLEQVIAHISAEQE